MVKFAFIKEVDLEDPKKCDGCIFRDTSSSEISEGLSYCNATEEGFLLNMPGRPDWCPLVLNYKEALRIAASMIEEIVDDAAARKEIIEFNYLIEKELAKDGPG